MKKSNENALDTYGLVIGQTVSIADFVAVTAANGGTDDDLKKVILIDKIFRKLNGRK